MADIKYYDVILKPVVTEKSMAGMGDKKYSFLVAPEATKNQIKEAVEDLLKVKVQHVRTMIFKGKEKRFGRILGRRNDWKKAIVTLADGQNIDVTTGI